MKGLMPALLAVTFASERFPHAWHAGAQTLLLRRQLEAMEDGGLAAITAIENVIAYLPTLTD